MTIKHNACFPCHHYRNSRNQYLYCVKVSHNFGRPKDCNEWSPEPGADYDPYEDHIDLIKASLNRFNEKGEEK